MHILWSLIIGLIVGALAKLFMPGKDPGGVIITMLLGVAGSLVAGFIGRSLGWYHSGTSGPGIIASVIGAMVTTSGCSRRRSRFLRSGPVPTISHRSRVFPWRGGLVRSRVRVDREPPRREAYGRQESELLPQSS